MKRALKWAGSIFGLLLVLLAATIVLGLNEATSRPVERRLTVELVGWPKDVAPVRIALLSDIHVGNRAMTTARLGAIVDQVNAAEPDLVLLAGDFVIGHEADGAAERAEALVAPLSRLAAPLGAIAVLGNHDHWTAPDAIRDALTRAHVTVLENDANRRGPLTVLGVGDVFSDHDDLARTLAASAAMGGIRVAVTHSPDLVHQLDGEVGLLLAGHTHCGQVVLPWIGPLRPLSPRQRWKPLFDWKYRCGVVRDRNQVTVVTAGLGSGSFPLRLGAPPDWWLVTLGPETADPRKN